MTTLQNTLELIEGYTTGRRRFRRADLDEANLCCFDLSGIDLVWSNLNWPTCGRPGSGARTSVGPTCTRRTSAART